MAKNRPIAIFFQIGHFLEKLNSKIEVSRALFLKSFPISRQYSV